MKLDKVIRLAFGLVLVLSGLAASAQEATKPAGATGLGYAIQEEKLARDVYRHFAQKWGERPFGNIAQAEQRHLDAVAGLLKRFGESNPIAGKGPGEFADAKLKALYAELIAKGERSRLAALEVGALIEELDIVDLTRELSKTTQPEIARVYESLLAGSRNHLRAFSSAIVRMGSKYVPQHLDRKTFDEIVSGRR
jgi:hypothetical protein